MHQDFTVFGNGPYHRGKGAQTFRRNLLTPLQSRISLCTSKTAVCVFCPEDRRKSFLLNLVYPYAKLHGVTCRNTVILNNQKHFLPKKVWSVWLTTGIPTGVNGLNETLGFDRQPRWLASVTKRWGDKLRLAVPPWVWTDSNHSMSSPCADVVEPVLCGIANFLLSVWESRPETANHPPDATVDTDTDIDWHL
jgi:hypothetical protein